MKKELKGALLIPTFNASKLWPAVLESVDVQSCSNLKKIIVDSGSNDDTVKLARNYGFEVHEILQSEFNHGATRQLLVNLSGDVDICIFLTQDAVLASTSSIEEILKAFDDPLVGIAYGRQLAKLNAKTLEAHLRLFNYPPVPEVLSLSDIDRKGFKVFFCSNSFAAYRKGTLNKIGGFPTGTIMGEDAIVAAKMILAGYKKAYVPSAAIYHSHSYKITEEFKRYFDTRVFHEQNKWLIENYGKPTGEGLKYVKSELSYVIKNDIGKFIKSIGSIAAKWLGYKFGKYYKHIPKNILVKLSMHPKYWKQD